MGDGPRYAQTSPPQLLDRVGGDAHLLLEASVRVDGLLEGLLDALPLGVEHPPMIHAAQPVLLRDAVRQVDTTVGAVPFDQAVLAGAVAVENEVFAEDADGLRGPGIQLGSDGDGLPVAAHQLAHRRAGPHTREPFVLSR